MRTTVAVGATLLQEGRRRMHALPSPYPARPQQTKILKAATSAIDIELPAHRTHDRMMALAGGDVTTTNEPTTSVVANMVPTSGWSRALRKEANRYTRLTPTKYNHEGRDNNHEHLRPSLI